MADRQLTFLFVGLGIILLFSMFNHRPIPSMEPRYAQVVEEMATTGEYLVPIKNAVPYVQYPPLNFWLGLAGKLAGLPTPAAIRLPCYLAFGLFAWWLIRLQRQLLPDTPEILLPLICVTLPNVFYTFFIAQSDALLVLGTLIAFTGFARFRLAPDEDAFPWELWSGVTLAVAAKGPIGSLLTLPAMFLEISVATMTAGQTAGSRGSVFRSWFGELWRMSWFRGLGLILLVNVPWYIAAGMFRGWDLVTALVVYQNFTRFIEGFGGHEQPWWYYGEKVMTGLFPVALVFPFAVYAGIKNIRAFPFRLTLVWALWSMFFLSLSVSKQGKYLIPAAPAFGVLAILTVNTLWSGYADRIFLWAKRWATALLVAGGLAVIFGLQFVNDGLGGHDFMMEVKAAQKAAPGRIVVFLWPRANMLYDLGAPLDYVRSSRELYARIHSGDIAPGDYILVDPVRINPRPDAHNHEFHPAPDPTLFATVATGYYNLYRVQPGAADQPVPVTPEPQQLMWYHKFDID
jgi:4-amino-4-deoxy-L-arabinose transferase-like glycosyltransferase